MASFKTLSGLCGAGVVNGAVFVGTTDADATEITTANFLSKNVAAGVNKGDAIVMNYYGTLGDPDSIRSDWFIAASVTDDTALQIISGYPGSGLGNPAGFSRKYLGGNIGAGGGSFNLYTYNNGIDNLDVIAAAGYFNDIADILEIGDVIYATSAQGAVSGRGADLLKVTANAAGVVTVAVTDFKQFVVV